MNFTKFFKRLMVCKQQKTFSLEMVGEVFHSPHCGMHLEQKWGIIHFMLHEFSTGIGNHIKLTLPINLGQDCPIPPGQLASPDAASVMRAYCRSFSGNATKG